MLGRKRKELIAQLAKERETVKRWGFYLASAEKALHKETKRANKAEKRVNELEERIEEAHAATKAKKVHEALGCCKPDAS